MKKVDYLLVISVILLTVFGLIMITSSSYIWAEYKFNNPYKYLINQGIFFLLSIITMYIVSRINYSFLYKYSKLLLFIVLILLILVIIPGIGSVRNGSRSWFSIGGFGIQPSEFAKLAIIIFASRYLSDNKNKRLLVLFLGLLLFGLIMLQPDFGTGMVLLMIVVSMLFISGMKMSFFIKIGFIGIIGLSVLIIIAPYRLKRILSFLDPWSDPLGSGFQIIQSLYAIGPGGLFGLGLGNSIQKHFYLPEPQTDFIFAIISEEFGFMGIIIVTTLFLTIIISSINIALKTKDLFSKYLVFGITFWIAFQTILNLMVVVGLIPVTGVTLPFLSYGGSSLLILYIGIGIILNVSRYQR